MSLQVKSDAITLRTSHDKTSLFYPVALCEEGYVLKVTNWKDSEQDEFYDAQNEMILVLARAGLAMPVCCSMPFFI